MKKILILLLFPVFANAQLENIKIVNFGLQERDLALIADDIYSLSDETFEMFQRFRASYRNSPPPTQTTIVTADTVSALALLQFYQFLRSRATFLTDEDNKRILGAVNAVVSPQLQAAISAYENSNINPVIQFKKKNGRRKLSGIKQ